MRGVIERVTVSAYHIGATLLLAWSPVLLIAAVPVHSALNLGLITLLPRSMPVLGTGLAAAGAI